MMEKIIALFEENQKTETAYDAAEAKNDQAGMEAARARHQELCQLARDNGKDFCFMLRLFGEMKECGNQMIDLHDCHEDNVAETISIFKKYGVKQFSFSSTWSSAIKTSWAFIQSGCALEGMSNINSQYIKPFSHGQREQVPAYIFTINE